MTEPLRYRGTNNRYVDIASRGPKEFLGFSIEYVRNQKTLQGCFEVRFVAHGVSQPFTHFQPREKAQFMAKNGTIFKGVRLNKVLIPVFDPAPYPFEVFMFGEKFGVWTMLEEWVAEQVQAEGFILQVDLKQEVRGHFELPATSEEKVKSIMALPDLKSESKTSFNTDEDEDDEDNDDEEKDEEKDWLN